MHLFVGEPWKEWTWALAGAWIPSPRPLAGRPPLLVGRLGLLGELPVTGGAPSDWGRQGGGTPPPGLANKNTLHPSVVDYLGHTYGNKILLRI